MVMNSLSPRIQKLSNELQKLRTYKIENCMKAPQTTIESCEQICSYLNPILSKEYSKIYERCLNIGMAGVQSQNREQIQQSVKKVIETCQERYVNQVRPQYETQIANIHKDYYYNPE